MKGVSHASKYMRRRVEERERGSPHPTPLTDIVTNNYLLRSSVCDAQDEI